MLALGPERSVHPRRMATHVRNKRSMRPGRQAVGGDVSLQLFAFSCRHWEGTADRQAAVSGGGR